MVHQVPPARALPDRILDAALICVARVGVAKTTLDDVAREAGCARATVYRCFPGKQPLLQALVAREVDRLTADVLVAARDAADLSSAAAGVLRRGARSLLDHEALQCVLVVEPELLLPHISFARGDALLAAAAERLAPGLTRFLDDERAARLAEWLVRIGFSYLCSSESAVLLDGERVRALVDDFVLPGLRRPASSEGIHA
jgi:AcrR family transcriptional regulator